jgi:hypothetical protein
VIDQKEAWSIVTLLGPGLLALNTIRSFYPAKKRDFQYDLCNYALLSFLCFIAVDLVRTKYGLSAIQTDSKQFSYGLYLGFLLLVGWLAGLIYSLALYIRYKLGTSIKRLEYILPGYPSTWERINSQATRPWVFVYLDNGFQYSGRIKYWNYDPDSKDQDFYLEDVERVELGAINSRRLSERGWKTYYPVTRGLYINTRNVVSIELFD